LRFEVNRTDGVGGPGFQSLLISRRDYRLNHVLVVGRNKAKRYHDVLKLVSMLEQNVAGLTPIYNLKVLYMEFVGGSPQDPGDNRHAIIH
jgi:hypothetical protein